METDREDGCLMEEESYGGDISVCRHLDKELDGGIESKPRWRRV